VETYGALSPQSPEEIRGDWRNFSLSRLKFLRDRTLGSLSETEFQGLITSPLLGRIRTHWNEADDEIRALYHAIMQRIEYERLEAAKQETVVEQKVAPRQVQPEELIPRRIQDSSASEPMRAPVGRHQEPVARPIIPTPSQGSRSPESSDNLPSQTPFVLPRANGELREEDEQAQETSPEQRAQSSALIQVPGSDEVLERLDAANAALDAANTLEQVKELADIGVVAHIYAQRAKKGALAENKAAAYVCRALAKLGRMMPASRAAGKLQKHGRPEKKDSQNPFSDSTEKPKTLGELGIGKSQASQARKLAKLPEPEFESRLKEKLDRLELSRTSTLQDPPARKYPEVTRFLAALLRDIEKVPDNYDSQLFVRDEKLLRLYSVVRQQFLTFVDAFELEVSGRIAATASETPAAPAIEREH
jgi:hypothetical protein